MMSKKAFYYGFRGFTALSPVLQPRILKCQDDHEMAEIYEAICHVDGRFLRQGEHNNL